MTLKRGSLWTIDELAGQAARALSVDYDGQSNGQVREVPDRRTIRYYTTLGLLDRPAAMLGRTALYGRRHLLQLVAIKRLQAEGRSLAELQERLVGLTDRGLERLAHLPALAQEAAPDERPAPAERGEAFWRESPAPVVPAEAAESEPEPASATRQQIPVADCLTLQVTTTRPLDAEDIEAVRQLAAPLLRLLEKRRLLRPGREQRRPS